MTSQINQAIRRTCLNIRNHLSTNAQITLSHTICRRIRRLHQYRYAKHIALYHAFNHEADLCAIWQSAPLHGKFCYFPVVNDNHTLLFLPATPSSNFHSNRYGILEPKVDLRHATAPSKFDMMFVPLVAFDSYGTRLGMGKGYYDRTLADERPKLLLGVGYEFQYQSYLEPNPWDIRLDAVVTEKTIYWSHP